MYKHLNGLIFIVDMLQLSRFEKLHNWNVNQEPAKKNGFWKQRVPIHYWTPPQILNYALKFVISKKKTWNLVCE